MSVEHVPSLADKMRLFATRSEVERAELKRLADELDAATAGFYGSPQTVPVQKLMGAWARARKAWCAASGESLI